MNKEIKFLTRVQFLSETEKISKISKNLINFAMDKIKHLEDCASILTKLMKFQVFLKNSKLEKIKNLEANIEILVVFGVFYMQQENFDRFDIQSFQEIIEKMKKLKDIKELDIIVISKYFITLMSFFLNYGIIDQRKNIKNFTVFYIDILKKILKLQKSEKLTISNLKIALIIHGKKRDYNEKEKSFLEFCVACGLLFNVLRASGFGKKSEEKWRREERTFLNFIKNFEKKCKDGLMRIHDYWFADDCVDNYGQSGGMEVRESPNLMKRKGFISLKEMIKRSKLFNKSLLT